MSKWKRSLFLVMITTITLLMVLSGCAPEETVTDEEVVAPDQDEDETGLVDFPPETLHVALAHGTGSSQDAVTRAFGDVWGERLGSNLIYDNQSGASGRVGYDYFLQTIADDSEIGHALLSSNIASAAIMYKQQGPDWDWEEDVYPLGLMAIDPGVYFVRNDSEFETFEDLVNAATERPLTLGFAFWASPDNLLAHQIMEQTGAVFEPIPNEDAAETVTQVLGGHQDFGYEKIASIMRMAEGEVRILAISMPDNPIPHITDDAPTVDEALGTDTLAVASYRCINVTRAFKDNYPEQYDLLRDAFSETLQDPEYLEAAERAGVDPDLIVDYDPDQIMDIIKGHWRAFEEFGDIYED